MKHNLRDSKGRFVPAKSAGAKQSKKGAKKSTKSSTKSNTILNVLLLDDSASMSWDSKADNVISSYNELLEAGKQDQKKLKITYKDCLVTFAEESKFATHETVSPLSSNGKKGTIQYRPNGSSTALWSSLNRVLTETCPSMLSSLPKNTKVIVTVFTDGQNNSGSVTVHAIKKVIEKCNSKGWVINFIGAGSDAQIKATAFSAGIYETNTVSFDNTGLGATQSINKLSSSRSSYSDKVSKGIEVSNDGFFSNE